MKSLDSDKNASKAGDTAEVAADDSNGFFTPNEKINFSNVKVEPLFEEDVDFDTFSKSDFRAVKVKECVAVPKSKKLLQFTLDDGTGTDRTILSGIHAYYEPEELVGKTLIAITNLPPRKMMGIESCGPKIVIDVPMPVSYLSRELTEQLKILEPFGKGNTKPIFAQKGLRVLNLRIFGKNQNVAKMKLEDQTGMQMDAVYFGEAEKFADFVRQQEEISVTYYPEINVYQGRETLQVVIRNYC